MHQTAKLLIHLGLALTAALGAARSHAQVMSLVSHNVVTDSANQVATFMLTFDRVPDFSTFHPVGGQQADSFWIDILNNPGPQSKAAVISALPAVLVWWIRRVVGCGCGCL
jgi:hypothetical protein